MPQTLWTNQVPDSPNEAEGAPGIASSHTVQFTEPGSIIGVQLRVTTTKGGLYTPEVWECTGADDTTPDGDLLTADDPVDASALTAGTYEILPLETPVVIDMSKLYRCAVHNSQGRYSFSAGVFSLAGMTSGSIVAYQNGTDPNPPGLGGMRQGAFQVGAAGVYPGSSGNGAAYYVGPVFLPDSEAVSGTGALDLDFAVAGAGRKVGQGLAGLGLSLALAAAGRKLATGTGALTLDLSLAAGVPPVARPPAALVARARSSAMTARGSTSLTARGGYQDA